MKLTHLTCLTLAALLAFTITGCDQGAETDTTAPAATTNGPTDTATTTAASDTGAAAEGEGEDAGTGVPDDYPLKVCVVSGEPLGTMGDPIKVSHEGRDAYLCCSGCVEDFKENPEQHLAKLDAAQAGEGEAANTETVTP